MHGKKTRAKLMNSTKKGGVDNVNAIKGDASTSQCITGIKGTSS